MKEVTLKIRTQNIWGTPLAKHLDQRLTLLTESFAQDEIINLQEVFVKKAQDHIKKKYSHHLHLHEDKMGRIAASGLATLSPYSITKKIFERFHVARYADSFSSKGILFTEVAHPELGMLEIFNTHLQASYLHRKQYSKIRHQQLEQLTNFVKKHSNQNSFILTGDFNFHDDTDLYQKLIRDLNLTDVFRILHPKKKLLTFHRGHKYVSWFERGRRLDYIFIRPKAGWKWTSEKSTATLLDKTISPIVSDHIGLQTSLIFQHIS